jgi:RimJ/RimL family protein N-acetyltransferase
MSLLDQLAGATNPTPTQKREARKILHEGYEVDVIPYNANYDPNAASFLPWLWAKLKEDGLIRLYFPDAVETGFAMFTRMMSGGANILLVVMRNAKTAEIEDVVGFASWEPMQFGQAQAGHAGFIFTKAYWDHETTNRAAMRIMRFWFEDTEPKLDIAIGIIAESNTLAQRFLKRIGWAFAGRLPKLHQYEGKQCAAMIYFVERADYERMGAE